VAAVLIVAGFLLAAAAADVTGHYFVGMLFRLIVLCCGYLSLRYAMPDESLAM
jgi:hypothetical protein